MKIHSIPNFQGAKVVGLGYKMGRICKILYNYNAYGEFSRYYAGVEAGFIQPKRAIFENHIPFSVFNFSTNQLAN